MLFTVNANGFYEAFNIGAPFFFLAGESVAVFLQRYKYVHSCSRFFFCLCFFFFFVFLFPFFELIIIFRKGDVALGQAIEILERETSKSNPYNLPQSVQKFYVVNVAFQF